jgi:hypothetical protein
LSPALNGLFSFADRADLVTAHFKAVGGRTRQVDDKTIQSTNLIRVSGSDPEHCVLSGIQPGPSSAYLGGQLGGCQILDSTEVTAESTEHVGSDGLRDDPFKALRDVQSRTSPKLKLPFTVPEMEGDGSSEAALPTTYLHAYELLLYCEADTDTSACAMLSARQMKEAVKGYLKVGREIPLTVSPHGAAIPSSLNNYIKQATGYDVKVCATWSTSRIIQKCSFPAV